MTLKVDLLNTKGESVGDLTLPKEIFGVVPNQVAISQYVRVYLTNQTQGTHKTKTKSEVSGGGRKPYAQKHTGRARRGSTRTPVAVGGGISHGPIPYTKRLKISKSQNRAALASVLSEKAISKDIIGLDNLSMEKFKTSEMINIIKAIKAKKKTIFVVDSKKDKKTKEFVLYSARNIQGIKIIGVNNINVFDILNSESVVFEKEAITGLKERFV